MFCLKFAEFRPSRCPNGCQRRGGHPGGRVCQQNRNYDQREAHRRMPRRPHPLGARWPVDARGRAAVMTPIIAMTPRAPRRELPTKDQRSGGAVTCYNVNLGFREFQISVHQNLNPAEGRSQSNPDIPRDRRGGAFRQRVHMGHNGARQAKRPTRTVCAARASCTGCTGPEKASLWYRHGSNDGRRTAMERAHITGSVLISNGA